MQADYERLAGRSVERIAALSDGIFAVAMTLIVLEIRVPGHADVHTDADLLAALWALAPRFLMYLTSFLTLGIFWSAQQAQLNHLARADRDVSWLHLLFLAFVVLLPFSTTLLAEHLALRTALIIYWLNIVLLGVVLLAAWQCANASGLVRDDLPASARATFRRRVLFAQSLYALGAALCLFDTRWSIGFILLVQLYFAIAPRIRPLRMPA